MKVAERQALIRRLAEFRCPECNERDLHRAGTDKDHLAQCLSCHSIFTYTVEFNTKDKAPRFPTRGYRYSAVVTNLVRRD